MFMIFAFNAYLQVQEFAAGAWTIQLDSVISSFARF